MTKTKLKKHLQTLTKEQIIELVAELYDARKEAKEYLELYLSPDSKAEVEKRKDIIRGEFFPGRGFTTTPSFSKCWKVISDFQKLRPDPHCVADLMLFYIEQGCEYSVTFGDMWEQYYTTLENNFEKAVRFIVNNGLALECYKRIEELLDKAQNCGWEFGDTLADIYFNYNYKDCRLKKMGNSNEK